MLLGESRESLNGRDGALTENPRFQTGQIDDGRRSTGQLAAVQRGSDPSADPGPPLSAPPGAARALPLISAGPPSGRRGSASPWRLALVAATTRTRPRNSAATPLS